MGAMMEPPLRHALLGEFLGTALLVLLGDGVVASVVLLNKQADWIVITTGWALAVTLGIYVSGRLSGGHLNPAVTLAFMVARRIEAYMAGVYVAAQLLGAIAAAFVAKMVVPIALYTGARGGGQVVSLDVSFGQAVTVELVATFIVVWVVFATAVDSKAPRVGGLAIGFAMTAGILAIGPLTGGSLNPARAIGPAVASGSFEGQVVFWTGPLVGGLLAGLLYDQLFLRRSPTPEPVDHGAIDPV
jgi:MIP family channel proteins